MGGLWSFPQRLVDRHTHTTFRWL